MQALQVIEAMQELKQGLPCQKLPTRLRLRAR
jgi:hypothetical protein